MQCIRIGSRRSFHVLNSLRRLSIRDKPKFTVKSGACFGTSSIRLLEPQYTSAVYTNVQRGNFAELTERDVTFFEALMPSRVLRADTDLDLEEYNVDWLRICRGRSKLVLRPKTSEEVSEILKYCNERRLAVVPQGGNTGLVGGSVPVFDEIVISMSLMNKITGLDPVSGVVTCEAGCILQNLEEYVGEQDFIMPLDLGAKGSCHIGGNIATNAGGMRLIRYGSLHGSVLGLEVVLPNGEIIDCLSTLRKDNTGYDMKQLFIGSEGTLGIITKAAILCPIKPTSTQVVFLGLTSFQKVIEIYKEARRSLAEVLSAFEFLDHHSVKIVDDYIGYKSPIEPHEFYVLIEVSGSNGQHNEEKLNHFLEKVLDERLAENGTVAVDGNKINNIWAIRENVAVALRMVGHGYKYDISLPPEDFYTAVEVMRERLGSKSIWAVRENVIAALGKAGYVYTYDLSLPREHNYTAVDVMRERLGSKVAHCSGLGHIADGNVHLNMTTDKFSEDVLNEIEPFIFELTAKYRGSISAEHGLGFKKNNFITYSKSDAAVRLMFQMKNLLDPKGIMNPYKVLPSKPL